VIVVVVRIEGALGSCCENGRMKMKMVCKIKKS
jgi:hypothetical protein